MIYSNKWWEKIESIAPKFDMSDSAILIEMRDDLSSINSLYDNCFTSFFSHGLFVSADETQSIGLNYFFPEYKAYRVELADSKPLSPNGGMLICKSKWRSFRKNAPHDNLSLRESEHPVRSRAVSISDYCCRVLADLVLKDSDKA